MSHDDDDSMTWIVFFVPQAISKDCWDNLRFFSKHLAQLLELLQSVCMASSRSISLFLGS